MVPALGVWEVLRASCGRLSPRQQPPGTGIRCVEGTEEQGCAPPGGAQPCGVWEVTASVTAAAGTRPAHPLSPGAWLLTLDVEGLAGLKEVILQIQLRVPGQRAPQRLAQHGLQEVHPAQGAAHGVEPQSLLLPQDGALQVGLACTGHSCHMPHVTPGPQGQGPSSPSPGYNKRAGDGFWVHPEGQLAGPGGSARCAQLGRGKASPRVPPPAQQAAQLLGPPLWAPATR